MSAMLKLHLALLKQHFIAQRDTEYLFKTTWSFLIILTESDLFVFLAEILGRNNIAVYSQDKTGTLAFSLLQLFSTDDCGLLLDCY